MLWKLILAPLRLSAQCCPPSFVEMMASPTATQAVTDRQAIAVTEYARGRGFCQDQVEDAAALVLGAVASAAYPTNATHPPRATPNALPRLDRIVSSFSVAHPRPRLDGLPTACFVCSHRAPRGVSPALHATQGGTPRRAFSKQLSGNNPRGPVYKRWML